MVNFTFSDIFVVLNICADEVITFYVLTELIVVSTPDITANTVLFFFKLYDQVSF